MLSYPLSTTAPLGNRESNLCIASLESRQTVKVTLAEPRNTLIISGLPKDLSEAELEDKLKELTQVHQFLKLINTMKRAAKFSLVLDENYGSRGYGFATFKDHNDALAALKNLQNASILGHPIHAKMESEHKRRRE